MVDAESAAGTPARKLPVETGLFRIPTAPGDAGALIGSRCRVCGEVFLRRRRRCGNCSGPVDVVDIGQRGKLRSFTTLRQSLPGAFVQAPYAVGKIQLPEGPLVSARIEVDDPDSLEFDQPVELVIRTVGQDDYGNEVVGFLYRPTGAGAGKASA